MARHTSFPWHLVDDAPETPGLYAWYYKTILPRHDVDNLITEVGAASHERAVELVSAFFRSFVFRPLEEEPYHAVIEGKLKPKYQGKLAHISSVSEDLVKRVANDVERIRAIADALECCVPHFASPVYIGMSKSLRTRLRQHKRLIEKFIQARRECSEVVEIGDDEADLSFAKDVARRGLVPNRLVVFVTPVRTAGDEYKDIENLLNRLYFPLCGRN